MTKIIILCTSFGRFSTGCGKLAFIAFTGTVLPPDVEFLSVLPPSLTPFDQLWWTSSLPTILSVVARRAKSEAHPSERRLVISVVNKYHFYRNRCFPQDSVFLRHRSLSRPRRDASVVKNNTFTGAVVVCPWIPGPPIKAFEGRLRPE